ncbi:hypothetical protein [Microvirga tunisiensis]|uniref:Uncharacterized protein n=1 Tax=Microvirga tunisiensis TaxID=2108360 RepID=A0A5N7MIT7_9HYPH|nr:hypothetical protein [Microvirga tunisiensis]MPR05656.1 hypothetical protein [Microvirga tunisiensis]MPR23856.1 hypothetical protein [Microvirga tunisiensis]
MTIDRWVYPDLTSEQFCKFITDLTRTKFDYDHQLITEEVISEGLELVQGAERTFPTEPPDFVINCFVSRPVEMVSPDGRVVQTLDVLDIVPNRMQMTVVARLFNRPGLTQDQIDQLRDAFDQSNYPRPYFALRFRQTRSEGLC